MPMFGCFMLYIVFIRLLRKVLLGLVVIFKMLND